MCYIIKYMGKLFVMKDSTSYFLCFLVEAKMTSIFYTFLTTAQRKEVD